MEKVEKRKDIIASIIILAIIATIISVIVYFTTRPEIRNVKFSSISFEDNQTYVSVNLDASARSEMDIDDFAIYAEGFPVSAYRFDRGLILDTNYKFEVGGNYTITIIFQLKKSQIDTPVKVLYKSKPIV